MELLYMTWAHKPLWIWALFIAIILSILVFDLTFLNSKKSEIDMKKSLYMSGFYVILGIAYGFWVWSFLDFKSATEYWTAYLVETSLSMDNVFIISLIFSYFSIPRQYQHRVLFWGILGVIVMRAIMIGLGVALVSRFEWINYVFAAFLVITGIKMLFSGDDARDIGDNPLLKYMRSHFNITKELHGHSFWVRLPHPQNPKKKSWWMTPLFVSLVLVEAADLVFAVDSIPAVFAITHDSFIVYTSNIFAIIGLRAMYFSLAVIVHKFYYLKYSLSLILIFIGGKIFMAWLMGVEKISPSISLSVTALLLVGGVAISLLRPRNVSA